VNIIKLLKSKGLRAGKVRVDFLQYLLDVGKPISAVDILQKESMQSVSKSTIYRNIDDLLEAGLIESVHSNSDSQLYEIKTDHHHHHFNCTQCGWMQCLDVSELESVIKKVESKLSCNGLIVSKHILGFEGLCKNCK
jgi:Fe2+ or Zn2+ uptake regulation protein